MFVILACVLVPLLLLCLRRLALAQRARTPKCARALLVVAHPDDETMFFSLSIQGLTAVGCELHVLCLSNGKFRTRTRVPMSTQAGSRPPGLPVAHVQSTGELSDKDGRCAGNANGLGKVRREEMYKACAAYQVSVASDGNCGSTVACAVVWAPAELYH